MIHFSEKLEPQKILHLLSHGMPYYLKSWNQLDEYNGLFGKLEPTSFNMKEVGVSSPVIEYVIRPHLHILCILASYLYKNDFTSLTSILSKTQAIDILNKGINWVCQTHLSGTIDVEQYLERKRWGENWRSSQWASLLAMASLLAKPYISPELIEKVKSIIAFEADRFIAVLPPDGCNVDTKLEENAFDTMVLAWALNTVDNHPNAGKWEEALRLWAVNIAASIYDKADHSEYFGKSINSWVMTQTVYPDMTAENHGFFDPEIFSYNIWIVLAMAAYAFNNKEPPFYLRRKTHQKLFDLFLRFYLPNGMIYSPCGHDLPYFIPRPFALAWGLWNNDPRALSITVKLLSWMDSKLVCKGNNGVPWVYGFEPTYDGWELFFQSQVGFELAMLAVLPFPKEFRFYSSGQIENAVDTSQIFPFVEICYRRNSRTSRSVAWKAFGNHPLININIHNSPELIVNHKANLLGIPSVYGQYLHSSVAFHHDHYIKDGFDTYGRIFYSDSIGRILLRRDIRILTWGDEGLVIFDELIAEQNLRIDEQYLSPIYFVNDHWTDHKIYFSSGSLSEIYDRRQTQFREVSCPSFWASIDKHVLFQFIWERTKGLVYIPSKSRNSPPFWKNCKLDMLAVRVEARQASAGDCIYRVGFYVGAGKGPRPFKCTGNYGEFFRGLVVMDGKNTIGL